MMRAAEIDEEAKTTARNRNPLPRNTVAKKRSSCSHMRSRSTPMNHKKVIPAKGNRPRARLTDLALLASHIPGSFGLSGTERRRSTTQMPNRIENRIPATAPARGAFSLAEIVLSFWSFIIFCKRRALSTNRALIVPAVSLPVDNVRQSPRILIQVHLQFTLFVNNELRKRIDLARALALVLVVDVEDAGGQVIRHRLTVRPGFSHANLAIRDKHDPSSG